MNQIIFTDPQIKWTPLMVSLPYYSHFWGVPFLGGPWKSHLKMVGGVTIGCPGGLGDDDRSRYGLTIPPLRSFYIELFKWRWNFRVAWKVTYVVEAYLHHIYIVTMQSEYYMLDVNVKNKAFLDHECHKKLPSEKK